jgi:hypothetical protein
MTVVKDIDLEVAPVLGEDTVNATTLPKKTTELYDQRFKN